DESLGKKFEIVDVPEEFKEAVEKARHDVIEAAVSHDEALIEKYFRHEELTVEEIRHAIRSSTVGGFIVPVLCGAAFKNKGVQAMLVAVVDFLQSPADVPAVEGHLQDGEPAVRHPSDDEPFAGLAFKIATDPVVGQLACFG